MSSGPVIVRRSSDSPRIVGRALDAAALQMLKAPRPTAELARDIVAAWDFGADIALRMVRLNSIQRTVLTDIEETLKREAQDFVKNGSPTTKGLIMNTLLAKTKADRKKFSLTYFYSQLPKKNN